jgi:predicted RNA-binding Zn ribbon-like protein
MDGTTVDGGERQPAPGRLLLVQQLLNTYEVDLDVDALADLDALERWLRERELIAPGERLADGDLERGRAFREALRTLLEERAHGHAGGDAAAALNALAPGALMRCVFDADGVPRLEAAPGGLDRALAALLAIVATASIDGTWARLKVCAEDSCRWAFYDRSKNRSGSWCSMAVCGNRAKARSYRARHRAAPEA